MDIIYPTNNIVKAISVVFPAIHGTFLPCVGNFPSAVDNGADFRYNGDSDLFRSTE